MDETKEMVLKWFVEDGHGASAKCMASHLIDQGQGIDHPHDGGDFGRCLRLLDAAPTLRGRIHKMAVVSKQWSALVDNWDSIEVMVRSGDDIGAYEFMSGILNPIDEADQSVIVIGDGITLRFGG